MIYASPPTQDETEDYLQTFQFIALMRLLAFGANAADTKGRQHYLDNNLWFAVDNEQFDEVGVFSSKCSSLLSASFLLQIDQGADAKTDA